MYYPSKGLKKYMEVIPRMAPAPRISALVYETKFHYILFYPLIVFFFLFLFFFFVELIFALLKSRFPLVCNNDSNP